MSIKNYVYALIPEFDQTTQYVSQQVPVDMGDHYFVGIEVHRMEIDDTVDEFIYDA